MLTDEQIQSLFIFCEKHFVKYYDVQVELVDHLANAVELEMKTTPKVSFEQALQKVHQSFGIMGFAPLVAEKEKMAEGQGRKLFWKLFKEQFKWPKVLLLLLIISMSFSLFTIDMIIFRIFYIAIVIGCWCLELYGIAKIHNRISSTGKKFLIAKYSQNSPGFFFALYLLQFPQVFDKNFPPVVHGNWSILFLSSLTGIFVIMTIANLQTLDSLKNNLQKAFPEVFAVSK